MVDDTLTFKKSRKRKIYDKIKKIIKKIINRLLFD